MYENLLWEVRALGERAQVDLFDQELFFSLQGPAIAIDQIAAKARFVSIDGWTDRRTDGFAFFLFIPVVFFLNPSMFTSNIF